MYRRIPVSRLALATSVALVLLLAGSLLLRSWLGTVVVQTATLTNVSGMVEVLPAGGDIWQPAAPGGRVTVGDRIRTGGSSAVTLAFFDGSVTSLEAQTELTVSQLSGRRDGRSKVIVLHQWMGRTYNRVQRLLDPASRFEIETPTAVTAVRGTVFVVEVTPDGATQVTVGEGLVEVTAQERTIEVRPGQATTVQPKQPPAPVTSAPTPLPPATPQPSATPSPFRSPTATLQPTRALPPTQTPYPPGYTPQPTPTHTPHPVHTGEPTETPEPTETEEPEEPTETPKPTHTPTPTGMPMPTHSPTPTKTHGGGDDDRPQDGDLLAATAGPMMLWGAMVVGIVAQIEWRSTRRKTGR